ncbi:MULTISPECIES: DUF805 domain-containing protein [Leuconostoc]|uniref:DUF805 domain-containing protein n=1 Tax=Leuconostoc kimchii TaxID=136609 RepID=A0ABX5SHN1_9LACO|nr:MULTISPECIES: DUF805 domain-containing protein [Leuconostoc]AEJ31711.1 hypothetical protein LGMK_08310 [Leuconostoc sp. C2]MBM7436510.1 uncharacterized membrane protein YhaH (DUF805 family) [Leuconostoc rapi]QBR46847.1 DUF805 domain-containing protein [Leuconostoc kimchii]
MSAWGALTDFFKRYTSFRGTSSRRAYNWMTWFWGVIYVMIAVIIIGVAGLGSFLGKHGEVATDTRPLLGTIILVLLISLMMSIIVIIPNLALYSRRLHDMGYSGWWQVVPLIINVVITLGIMYFGKSESDLSWGPSVISFGFSLWLSFMPSKTNTRYS